jgi:hypothetical protein
MIMRSLGIYAVLAVTLAMTSPVQAETPTGKMDMPASDSKTMSANAADTREVVMLTQEERAQVLTRMRQMLVNVQEITAALARGDKKAVAQAASGNGAAMMQDMPQALHMKFPPAFPKMGMPMHQHFDQIAKEAGTAKSPAPILKLLSEGMQSCVACHAAYRFDSPK